jgi:DNA-binding NtrC family response regulator
VNNVRQQLALRRENTELRKQVAQKYVPRQAIMGSSPPMQQLFKLIDKAARTPITVSVSGETGTGKELVA